MTKMKERMTVYMLQHLIKQMINQDTETKIVIIFYLTKLKGKLRYYNE